jgi:drug/metabolite transporter (DMT)-like permease
VNLRGHLALAAVVVVWAGSFSVIKALLDDGVAAGDVALWRYAVAASGFALVLWRAGGSRASPVGTRSAPPAQASSSWSGTTSS